MDLSKFLRDYTRVNASQTCAKKLQQSQVVVWVFKNGKWKCAENDRMPRIGESYKHSSLLSTRNIWTNKC